MSKIKSLIKHRDIPHQLSIHKGIAKHANLRRRRSGTPRPLRFYRTMKVNLRISSTITDIDISEISAKRLPIHSYRYIKWGQN